MENREALERTWLFVETVGPKTVFEEEHVLHGKPLQNEFPTTEACQTCGVPSDEIVSIPIVMWKLLEMFELRAAAQLGTFPRTVLLAHSQKGAIPMANRRIVDATETESETAKRVE